MKKVFVSITTTRGSDWRKQIREIKKRGLEEAALFLTCLEKEGRKKLYGFLEKNKISNIPFVHIRNDMAPRELDYLIKNFKTEKFNIHTGREFPLICDYPRHRKKIFIENIYLPLDEEEVKSFAGICLDLAHLENDRVFEFKKFKHNLNILEKYPIGCNHISCFQETVHKDDRGHIRRDRHFMSNISELNYLKKYPKRYFSDTIALELENDIETQLKARDCLLEIIRE